MTSVLNMENFHLLPFFEQRECLIEQITLKVPQDFLREMYFERRVILFRVDAVFVRLIAMSLDIGRYFIATVYNDYRVINTFAFDRIELIH